MYSLDFVLSGVHHTMPDELLIKLNQAAVEGLACVDSVYFDHYNIPGLYAAGVRYHHPEVEQWKDIGAVLRDKVGDCKDLTAWRLAELWRMGVHARAESIVQRYGKVLSFHTFIRFPNGGGTEDPSRILGMT